MEILNEASIPPFSIGPTSACGRIAAFYVLSYKSMTHLKHQVFRVILFYWFKIKNGLRTCLVPFTSWFHPRKPLGIVLLCILITFYLKQHSIFRRKDKKRAYQVDFWVKMLRCSKKYDEWVHAAKMLEIDTPRKMNEDDLYDVELVRNKLHELRHRRQEGSIRDIMFYMRADLVRNLGNMCNPELHMGRLQVPRLIREYIAEVSTQLRMVCNSDSEDFPLEEKLTFMQETRHAFGRTALLLSGGASLGAFHIGVVETLIEHKLLPRIVAGSSVGSIMAAVLATKSWAELQDFFYSTVRFFDSMGGVYVLLKRIMTSGVVHDIRHLQGMLRNLTGNMTFQEAYFATGRILGITVCSPRKHEPPRCLNYLTSPHVLIWSAVTASCAFPGLFEAQELMAKTRNGELVPYHPPFHLGPEEGGSPANGRRWRDGSLQADLPMIHLKELFNVNHFIVSQANPHIAPLLRLKEYVRSCGGNFAAKLALLAEMEVKHRSSQLLELGFPFGKLFAQDWEGDVTIVMSATLMQYLKIIQNPSESDIRKAAEQARRCTFEKLSAIKANCGIEVALDDCVSVIHHMRKLKRSAERAAAAASASQGLAATTNTSRFSAYKRRIPSWNCLSRELSAGSLDEEPLVATRNLQNQQNSRDGSDSDSERGVDHNSWTRSGGPLMRTTSADEFVEFVQNLGGGGDSNSRSQFIRRQTLNEGGGSSKEACVPGNNNSDGSSSRRTSDSAEFDQRVGSRIMVTEGDILQTEMIHNGIVLNVVKKEALTPSNNDPNDSSDHTSTYASEVAECMQLECPDGDLDTSSTSEGSDIDDRDQDQHC